MEVCPAYHSARIFGETPFLDCRWFGLKSGKDWGAKVETLESDEDVYQHRAFLEQTLSCYSWGYLFRNFQYFHDPLPCVFLLHHKVRSPKKDNTRYKIDEVLVSIQLFISNAECLLQHDTTKTVANEEHWSRPGLIRVSPLPGWEPSVACLPRRTPQVWYNQTEL